jgi:hypothetical protein
MKRILIASLISIGFAACQSNTNESNVEEKSTEVKEVKDTTTFFYSIEKAHNAEKWYTQEVFKANFNLVFGGKVRFDGVMYTTPNGGKTRLEANDGRVMIFDGQNAYISPDSSSYQKTRFDVLTWPYFLTAPYKLSDPGTNIEKQGNRKLADVAFDAAKLTFGENIGDAPDDWYILYKDKSTNLLAGMAYIVSYGKDVEKANEDPHCITYENFVDFNGIQMATTWNFWTWNEAGKLNKLLGTASLSYFESVNMASDLFTKSENSRLAPLPIVE